MYFKYTLGTKSKRQGKHELEDIEDFFFKITLTNQIPHFIEYMDT